MSNFVIITLLFIALIASNLVWSVHWLWWVPAIARKFTWLKRHKRSMVAIADDAGWVNFDFPEEILPEGVYRMKDDKWHFLPRPRFHNPDGTPLTVNQEAATQVIQRRFILKEMGIPFWIGYAGRLPLVNPLVLATTSLRTEKTLRGELDAIVDIHSQEMLSYIVKPAPSQDEQNKQLYGALASLKVELERAIDNAPNPQVIEKRGVVNCGKIENYIRTLPTEYQPALLKFTAGLNGDAGSPVPVTYVDNSDIKKMIPRSYTPTQVQAACKNRERYGELKANKSLWDKAMPIVLILGMGMLLVVITIVAKMLIG